MLAPGDLILWLYRLIAIANPHLTETWVIATVVAILVIPPLALTIFVQAMITRKPRS